MDIVTVTLFAQKGRSELRVVGNIKTRIKSQLLHTLAYVNWGLRNFGDRSVPQMEPSEFRCHYIETISPIGLRAHVKKVLDQSFKEVNYMLLD